MTIGVLTYHLRGTGKSTCSGPYEMETDAADLEAVLDQADGGPTLVVGLGDSSNRAIHLGARRPDLVGAVVALGVPLAPGPLALRTFPAETSMVGSEAVTSGFLEMLRNYYPAAMRTVVTASQPGISDEALRASVAARISHCPQAAAVGRIAAWIEDDPKEDGRALGSKLCVITSPTIAGPWMPDFDRVQP